MGLLEWSNKYVLKICYYFKIETCFQMTNMLFTAVAVEIAQTDRIGAIRESLDMKASSCTFTVLVLSFSLVDFYLTGQCKLFKSQFEHRIQFSL